MAFPGLSKKSLESIWSRIKVTAGFMKDKASQLNAAASLTRKDVLDFQNGLADALFLFDSTVTTPGLLAYAQAQENDPALDLVSEFNAMRTQIVSTQDWTVTNFPKDASGNLAVYSFDVNKRFANINLTTGQLNAFKTQLAALSATVN